MSSVNMVILLGNLTNDPETKSLAGGNNLVRFSVATSKRFKTKDGEWTEVAVFHNCTAWGMLGENIAKQLKKGSKVHLIGEIESSNWLDKTTGAKRTATSIKVDKFTRLSPKPEVQELSVDDISLEDFSL